MLRRPRLITLAAVAVGALALGAVAVPLTNQPKFCASCHTIAPSYESWVQSSHKSVECVTCHVRPGIEGFLHDKVYAGLKDSAIHLFGTPPDPHNLQARVDSHVCLDCHHAILRVSEIAVRDLPKPVKDVGLIMSHRAHMTAFEKRGQGEGCTTCHSRVVHDRPIKGYPIVIPRGHVEADNASYPTGHPDGTALHKAATADCFRCHDGKTTYEGRVLSRKCETCHIPEKLSELLF
jgi:cytochrome c nitrite reductase small subunit